MPIVRALVVSSALTPPKAGIAESPVVLHGSTRFQGDKRRVDATGNLLSGLEGGILSAHEGDSGFEVCVRFQLPEAIEDRIAHQLGMTDPTRNDGARNKARRMRA